MTRFCAGEGVLVDGRLALLGEGDAPPSEDELTAGRVVGCTHLRCRECGADVVEIAGRAWTGEADAAELAHRYDTRDFDAVLVARDKFRAYACRCRRRTQLGHVSLRDLRVDTIEGWPWACAGH